MSATPHSAQPQEPRRAWTILTWCVAVAFPFALFVTLGSWQGNYAALRLLIPAVITCMPAGLLRRSPLTAVALMLAGSVAAMVLMRSWQLGYVQILTNGIAIGYLAATKPRRISIAAAAMVLGVQIFTATAYSHTSNLYLAVVAPLLSASVAAWLIGNSIRERRIHAEALLTQATVQAVTAERLRIARELHDMVAHSIGIIAIQAGVGGRVIDTQPAEARNALFAIEATSRETLAGLRRTLGTLRQAEPGHQPDPAPLDPAPGLADLERLAAATMAAGVTVEVHWRGPRRPVPADIDLSAFRIIQEAITNVVRHAGTGHCRVSVDHRDEDLFIEVVDDGCGGTVAGGGYGLVGMHERVGLLDGDLTVGPRPEGGFRVAARLPVPAGVR